MSKRHRISWTDKDEEGRKRDVRVDITKGGVTWRFKGPDDERWEHGGEPSLADWDALEEMLERRTRRGRALNLREAARRARNRTGG